MMKGGGYCVARWISLTLISLMLASSFHATEARSTGAPVDIQPEICSTMTPGHQVPASITASPYTMTANVNTFTANQQVTVTITTSSPSPAFKGIFLQMRRVDNDQIMGSWAVDNSDTNFQAVSCDGSSNNAVTHRNSNVKGTTNSFVWIAPATQTSDVKVVASFVSSYATFWLKVQGPTIQSSNPCNPNPCLSGGTCEPTAGGYVCNCPPLFTGPTCHLIVFACDSNPCENGGTCGNMNQESEFTCGCTTGFTGTRCEVGDTCISNPCFNGGTCQASGINFVCVCPTLFAGHLCQINAVACHSNPCTNGGTCIGIDQKSEYICICQLGHAGTQCETAISPCEENSCENGATCNGVLGNVAYTCTCPADYTGALCQTSLTATPGSTPATTGAGMKLISNLFMIATTICVFLINI